MPFKAATPVLVPARLSGYAWASNKGAQRLPPNLRAVQVMGASQLGAESSTAMDWPRFLTISTRFALSYAQIGHSAFGQLWPLAL
jgi:hypothetical protein